MKVRVFTLKERNHNMKRKIALVVGSTFLCASILSGCASATPVDKYLRSFDKGDSEAASQIYSEEIKDNAEDKEALQTKLKERMDSSRLLLASFCVFPSKVFLNDEPSALCAVIRATHFFFFSLNSRLPSPFVRRLFSDFAIQPPFSSALGSLIGHLMRSKNLFLTGTANLSVKFRKEKSLQNHRITDNLESFI